MTAAPITPAPGSAGNDASDMEEDLTKERTFRTAPYWVSVSKRRGFRRLHRRNGCGFTAECEEDVYDLTASLFRARCGHCWKEVHMPKVTGDDKSVASGEVSSSTEEA